MAANGMGSCQDSYSDHVSFQGSGYARLGWLPMSCTIVLYSCGF